MRLGILFLILTATVFGSGFWYEHIDTQCRAPIRYRIGEIDSRFGTNVAEIQSIAAKAEQVWEVPLSTELFVYDSEAEFAINLVFDERQENADIENELKEDLEAKEGMSEAVSAQYQKLIDQFRSLTDEYELGVLQYESSLDEYNQTVTEWNDKGGAPEEVVSELRVEEAELTKEFSRLEKMTDSINVIVHELNKIGARGNSLIRDYNTVVEEYNNRFGEGHEFAQGDYTQNEINIYQFDSEDELVIVLAHEFGHALAFGHVENEHSVMYHLMGAQDIEMGITAEDIAEYRMMCEDNPFFSKLIARIFG